MKRIKAVDAQTIFSSLSDIIHEYNIKWENIVYVCFDGAASMYGCTTGVQAKFKEKNIFFGHCLNLVLVDAVYNRETKSNNIQLFWKYPAYL